MVLSLIPTLTTLYLDSSLPARDRGEKFIVLEKESLCSLLQWMCFSLVEVSSELDVVVVVVVVMAVKISLLLIYFFCVVPFLMWVVLRPQVTRCGDTIRRVSHVAAAAPRACGVDDDRVGNTGGLGSKNEECAVLLVVYVLFSWLPTLNTDVLCCLSSMLRKEERDTYRAVE